MKKHILYVRPMCMFCWRVMRVSKALGLEMEVRNIWENPQDQRELQTATGRATVPVLRIIDDDGASRWMPESADIVAYLREKFGE